MPDGILSLFSKFPQGNDFLLSVWCCPSLCIQEVYMYKDFKLGSQIEIRMVKCYRKMTAELQHQKGQKTIKGDRTETDEPSAL